MVPYPGLCASVSPIYIPPTLNQLRIASDIKPQNFVLRQDAHLLLIDFGSAAPLLPPAPDGSQRLPKRYCLVPCGTCDYISPEILQAHEAALVALELEGKEISTLPSSMSDEAEHGYGVETDWWSFGAMLYEMVYGVAPFFANEIRHTYQKIMNHEVSDLCLLFLFVLKSIRGVFVSMVTFLYHLCTKTSSASRISPILTWLSAEVFL